MSRTNDALNGILWKEYHAQLKALIDEYEDMRQERLEEFNARENEYWVEYNNRLGALETNYKLQKEALDAAERNAADDGLPVGTVEDNAGQE